MLTSEGGELTCLTVQLRQPLAARATATKAWRSDGIWLLPTQVTYRLRAVSIEVTTKLAASPASLGTLVAAVISLSWSPQGFVFGKSRKVRSPFASGVPMLSLMVEPSNWAWK